MKENSFTPDSQTLRKANRDMRQQVRKHEIEIVDEYSKKEQALKNHNNVSQQYQKTTDNYEKLLAQVEDSRNRTENDLVKTQGEVQVFVDEGMKLRKTNGEKEDTRENLTETLDALKKDLKKTEKRYEDVTKQLEDQKQKLDSTIKALKVDLSKAQHDINKLSHEAQKNEHDISRLSDDKDKVEKAEYGRRIKELIENLEKAETKRKGIQDALENAQEGWRTKLQPFADPEDAKRRRDENQ
jgi:chromosome segregation ATPase